MMHYSKVVQGLAAYADAEIISKLGGSMKAWVVGGALEIMIASAENIFRSIQAIPMIDALGIIDGENIDVDRLYTAFRKQAQKGPATVNVPLIGPITFAAADVDALYRNIKGV